MPVDHKRLQALVDATFRAAGSEPGEAAILADHLVEANLVGHDSHGVIRTATYLEWLKAGQVRPNRHARVTRDEGAMISVEGDGGYGQVIAREAIEMANARAAERGAAILAIRDSGHLGRVGAWAEMTARAGLLSIHFVNTSGFGIHVAPFGGSDRRLSANPIAAGIPVPDRPPIILDIATSIVAAGKIQVARNKGEEMPEGCILDNRGNPTRDPNLFFTDPPGAILPFGGHKGSGLSLLCEVLAGSLGGGLSSHPDNPNAGRLVNSMLSIVLDPAGFSSEAAYGADVTRLIHWVTGSPPMEPGGEVLLPGDPERRTRVEREARGIPLDPNTLAQLRSAAESVGVPKAELDALGA